MKEAKAFSEKFESRKRVLPDSAMLAISETELVSIGTLIDAYRERQTDKAKDRARVFEAVALSSYTHDILITEPESIKYIAMVADALIKARDEFAKKGEAE